ncbi:putative aldo/keto reductase [Periconia macrospinosa]|uniref:Putative aldo/keto reductase n=1 Tax=Periconia macrospinosa TaxID=97972 RepID=A0A2V1DHC4_9PLEO|nr:putative aldo/keto reductase [Periconia macrospinosa]
MSVITRHLGKNGPAVPAVSVGLMSLGHVYGDAGDLETRLNFLNQMYEIGARHWDAADGYGDVEEVVGEWFSRNPDKRKDIFYATKFGLKFSEGIMTVRNDPDYIHEAIEKSLQRSKTDYIDLYYCHRVDGKNPIEKTVECMAKLQRAGKVRHLGLSAISARTLQRAHSVAPIAAVQVEYGPFSLEIEQKEAPGQESVLETCKQLGVSVVAYSPLGQGFLTGKYRSAADFEDAFRPDRPDFAEGRFEKNLALVKIISQVAKDAGEQGSGSVTNAQVALAWVLRQWEGIVPIPGTRNAERVKENMAAANIALTDEQDSAIREAAQAREHGGQYADYMAALTQKDTPENTCVSG